MASLFEDPVFLMAHQALEDNKTLVIVLSCLLTFLVMRFIHQCLLAADNQENNQLAAKIEESPVNKEETAANIGEGSKPLNGQTLIEAFESARPPKDPIHEFMDGDREKLPFMCPFFEAFRLAKKRADKEKAEEENIARTLAKEREAKAKAQAEVKKSAPAPIEEKKSTSAVAEVKKSEPAQIEDKKSTPAAIKDNKSASEPIKDTKSASEPIEDSKSARALDEATNESKSPISSIPYSHLPGCLKRREQGKIMANLSDNEKAREREAVNHQLSEIYALLAQQQENEQQDEGQGSQTYKGCTTMDDVYSQMRLYSQ